MNIKEAVKFIEQMGEYEHFVDEPISKKAVLNIVRQIDETQKPVVPQFVADWYEENKDDFETKLFRFIESLSEPCEEDDLIEFIEWLIDDNTKTIQTLVNMHQFGYEVEKEKRYLVKFKATKHYFAKDGNGRIFFSLAYKDYFTRKQLEEADFGWVFDCEGIEIEEVE